MRTTAVIVLALAFAVTVQGQGEPQPAPPNHTSSIVLSYPAPLASPSQAPPGSGLQLAPQRSPVLADGADQYLISCNC